MELSAWYHLMLGNHAIKWIFDDAPRTTSKNEHLIWIQNQKNDLHNPVYGWRDNLLKEAIHNLAAGRNLAQKVEDYPLLLASLSNWCLLEILQPLLKTFMTKSILWIGEAGPTS
eukprot:6173503-Amphidinium_carterae.1